jgi:uncharacterized protein with PIN domain
MLFYNGFEVDVESFDTNNIDFSLLSADCEGCGKEIRGEDAEPMLDPLSKEVYDEFDLRILCPVCWKERMDEI